jgi:hypothetical protein
MSEPEDFLSRWSRRKREADAAREEPAADAPPGVVSPDEAKLEETPDRAQTAVGGEADTTGVAPFDLSKLPSLESITAETDIRPFLAAGVPRHLTQAALRLAWTTDPKIRDFIEIAENQWDFNGGTIPGFDFSAPADVEKMVAEIMGQVKQVAEKAEDLIGGDNTGPAPAQSPVSHEQIPAPSARRTTESEPAADTTEASASTGESGDKTAHSEAAPQQEEKAELEMSPLPRRHGSALPS